jgi:HEAT repeat protein
MGNAKGWRRRCRRPEEGRRKDAIARAGGNPRTQIDRPTADESFEFRGGAAPAAIVTAVTFTAAGRAHAAPSRETLRMSDAAALDPAALARQLASASVDERVAAAERLSQAGEEAAVAAVPLARACGDDDERVRELAVAALEDMGPPPADAVGPLGDLVGHRDPLVAYWAATLLGRAGEEAAAAVTALTACVASSADMSVRQRAAWALGRIGPAATRARGTLETARSGADQRLARLAAEALDAIGG